VSVSAPVGAFPADAVLTVNDPMPERRTLKAASITPFAAVPETDDSAGFITAKSYSYEITVTDAEGNHLQPAEGMTVILSFALAEADDPNLIPRVLHEGKEIPCYTENGAVIAETTGFSRYTVEFYYTEKEYVMPGDSVIPMSEILTTLGLTGEVTAVEISDTSLFSASNETGEWVVTDRNNRSAEFLYLDINFI